MKVPKYGWKNPWRIKGKTHKSIYAHGCIKISSNAQKPFIGATSLLAYKIGLIECTKIIHRNYITPSIQSWPKRLNNLEDMLFFIHCCSYIDNNFSIFWLLKTFYNVIFLRMLIIICFHHKINRKQYNLIMHSIQKL